MNDRAAAELAANLRCRARLGLGLVRGDAAQLARLRAILGGGGQAAPAPQSLEPGPGSAPAVPTELDSLEQIRAHMGQCKRCPLHAGRRNIVFGQGPADARLMFIGEGPGAQEDRQGLPFVGPAGQLLDQMLRAVGLRRDDVYITNIVKCRPPGNREPEAVEAAACRPFLDAQVDVLRPMLICTLGKPASQAVLASKAPISAMRGSWHEAWGVPVLPTFHPAYLLRSPARKAEAYGDMKMLAKRLAQVR